MKAVFFDLDGTLIDSDPYWVRSQETLVRSCGGEWSDALADALQGAAFPETVRLLRGAGVDWDGDAIVRHLSDEVLCMEKERRVRRLCVRQRRCDAEARSGAVLACGVDGRAAGRCVGCRSVSGFRGFQARVDGGSGVGRDGGRGHRSCACGYERQWAVR